MKVTVGSQNQVKIDATKQAFEKVWPNIPWEAVGADVSSGVPDQPMSDEESIKGATNRAKASLAATDADYGVGLEGGIQKIGENYFDCGWVVVINSDGDTGIGSSVKVIVPSKMMKLINGGMELGQACEQVFNGQNTKQATGHFGLMTDGIITRTQGYRDGVVVALARFMHPELF